LWKYDYISHYETEKYSKTLAYDWFTDISLIPNTQGWKFSNEFKREETVSLLIKCLLILCL
jgi:hypothetical protein